MRLGKFILAGWLAAMGLHAAEVAVTGRAIDENDARIGGVDITVTNAAGQSWHVTTDPAGGFTLRLPTEGQYLFSANPNGYLPIKNLSVEIAAPAQEVHLVLNRAKEVLQRIDVNAPPESVDIEQTQSERQLSGIQILDIPYPSTHSLREAMTLLPGLVEDPNGGLHFDGGRENQTNYLLDGFNISDPLTGQLNSTVSVESIHSIDYLSGRYSPEYGKGSAGVLQIKTETGDDAFRYSATNFIPGLSTQTGVHVSDWTPRVNFSGPIVKGRAWFADNLDADYNINIVPGLPSNEQRTSSLQLGNLMHAQVNVTPSNILYGDFLFNYLRAQEFGLGVFNPPSTTLDQRDRSWFVALKDQIYLGNGNLLEVGFAEMLNYFRLVPQGVGTYIITPNGKQGNYFEDSAQSSRRGQLLANLFLKPHHLAGTHQFKMGIDVDRIDYSQDTSRTGYDLYGVSGNLLRSVTFEGNGDLSRPSLEASSYITDHWQARSNLFFELGVRQDWDEILRHVEWSPRAAFSYAPFGPATRISGGFAIIYDPTIIQLFTRPLDQYTLSNIYAADGTLLRGNSLTLYTISNPNLQAPQFRNFSFGVDHDFPHRIRAGLALLRKTGGDGFSYINTLSAPILAPPDIANAYHASYIEQLFNLTNARHDEYDSAQVIVHQSLTGRYEWLASYTRSRARSSQVLDPSLEQTLLLGPYNSGPLPWDAPNRFLSWGYLPTPFKNWAVTYLLDARSGFPFSIQHDTGELIGFPDMNRFPSYFNLNFGVEWRLHIRKYRFAIRGSADNLTNHQNYTEVNNTLESPQFLTFYGSEGRHFTARLRWLGKE